MHTPSLPSFTRRDFLRRSGQLAMTGTALPLALNLAAMGEAAAFNAPGNDYKALVCVFLYGGNDYANTVVTYDAATRNTAPSGVVAQGRQLGALHWVRPIWRPPCSTLLWRQWTVWASAASSLCTPP